MNSGDERKEAWGTPGVPQTPTVRGGTLDDLADLQGVEAACFQGDRMSRRSLRWMLSKANGRLLVATAGEAVCGYVLVLFRMGSLEARIYSIAVMEQFRHHGVGALLLRRAEQEAVARGLSSMRLEVRRDGAAVIRFYHRQGYHQFGVRPDYYEDGMAALLCRKTLSSSRPRDEGRSP